MKRFLFLVPIIFSVIARAQIKYPETSKTDVMDVYGNGMKVIDPYRWLEDDNSEKTKQWVRDENKVTFDYLATIPFRNRVKERLEELWNYPKYYLPFKKNEYYYFFKNEGLQNQAILYRQKGLTGEPQEFINPNILNKDGIAALGTTSFSKSGKYTAYSIAVAGSDWQEVFLLETLTKEKLADKIEWTKFSGISWNGDDGF